MRRIVSCASISTSDGIANDQHSLLRRYPIRRDAGSRPRHRGRIGVSRARLVGPEGPEQLVRSVSAGGHGPDWLGIGTLDIGERGSALEQTTYLLRQEPGELGVVGAILVPVGASRVP